MTAPLWQTMEAALLASDPVGPGIDWECRDGCGDIIEATRDWLFPLGPDGESMRAAIAGMPPEFIGFYLRQILTEQARIARGES